MAKPDQPVTIRNKYLLLAAGLWLLGILLTLLGGYGRNHGWGSTGALLSIGILTQAAGFALFGFALMQAVFRKK